ncbi:MAG: metallophosphoesterase [Bacteroidota bacterium]|nr:metallophosphoesterase [Bacteroidota bacterium]
MSIFGTVLTLTITLLHLYVFLRLRAWLPPERNRIRRLLLITGALSWSLFLLGRFFGGKSHGMLTVALEVIGMQVLGSIFLLAVAVLAVDLLTGFGRLFRRRRAALRIAGLCLGLGLVVVAHVQGLRASVVERYEVTVERLPAAADGMRVAMLADLHLGEMMLENAWLEARVAQVRALQPDLVVLVGDIFEHAADTTATVPVLRRLYAPHGVWAVRGNHDRRREDRTDVARKIYAAAGIPLLENRRVQLREGLLLSGIDDLTSSRRNEGEGERNLRRALSALPDAATIHLSHTPWLAEQAAAAGVDLMLSGHTHAGQLWPFSYFVRGRYPFISGRYAVDDMTLIVSRGTGSWGPRMRLWQPGEITLITLRSPRLHHP